MAREPGPAGWEALAEVPATVVTVSVAVPASFATVMVATEQEAAGLTAGVTLQVNVTPEGSKPFMGLTLMVEVEDCPAVTEEGDGVDAERLKLLKTANALDVLAVKAVSPL